VLKGPLDYPGVGLSGHAWPTDAKGLMEYGDALADAVSVLTEDFFRWCRSSLLSCRASRRQVFIYLPPGRQNARHRNTLMEQYGKGNSISRHERPGHWI
jgi:hypothetical protein